jgi:hypothetical protein
MDSNARIIEAKIAALREAMRCTLDRSALPRMREELMAEILKLHAIGGDAPSS